MAEVLFISEEKLKSYAITGNVSAKHLLPHLKDAQRIYIESALGTDLYEKLQSDINDSTLSSPYSRLVNDYIQDCLVHYATLQAIPHLAYRIENGNIYSKVSETGNPLSREELADLKDSIKNTAEWYRARLVDYLHHNQSSFPEYSTNTGADIKASKSTYTNNMNLFLNSDDKFYYMVND
tara:strand:+ start:5569 stop:6108 length:540 start_codon:yes stop_codon:yes gene_type:complete